MKKAVLLVAVALLLGGDEAKKDIDLLQGTWLVVSLDSGDAKQEGDAVKGFKLTIKGNEFTYDANGVVYKGTFKIDPTKKPKELDITFTDGPDKGNTARALYEVDSETYKVCLKPGGESERPKALKGGDGCVLEVLKREKK